MVSRALGDAADLRQSLINWTPPFICSLMTEVAYLRLFLYHHNHQLDSG